MLCAAAKGPTGVQKQPPRMRPVAAQKATPGENASPQKVQSAGRASPEAATGRVVVATVARVYAQGEPVSPRAMAARLADVVFGC